MCLAHVVSMLGFSTWPTLLPVLQPLWGLTSGEAGLVSGLFFAGYMALVPFLSGLTDRMDARRVYAFSCLVAAAGSLGFALFAQGLWTAMLFQLVNGAGIAGTYMPGLKLLADHTSGRTQTRGVSVYTAVFGLGTSLSILVAGGLDELGGWTMAFGVAAAGPLLAAMVVLAGMPAAPVHAEAVPAPRSLRRRLDAVFRQGSLRYMLGYAVHCWELFGSRSWLVAFLTAAAVAGGSPGQAVFVAAAANLLAPFASVGGNEMALRIGREKWIWSVMMWSAVLTLLLGCLFGLSWPWLGCLAVLHVFLLMGDSGSLTAGMVAASTPQLRGLSMAVHSTLGFGAGFLAPLVFGLTLDLAGGQGSPPAWGAAFATLALPALAGAFLLRPGTGSGRAR